MHLNSTKLFIRSATQRNVDNYIKVHVLQRLMDMNGCNKRKKKKSQVDTNFLGLDTKKGEQYVYRSSFGSGARGTGRPV